LGERLSPAAAPLFLIEKLFDAKLKQKLESLPRRRAAGMPL
jgi:hypothetical protein